MPAHPLSNPRRILITGATGGIGSALALEYAAANRTLLLQGRDPERLTILAQRCEALGAVVEVHLVDLANVNARQDWYRELATGPALDLVILNAGVTSNIADTPDGESSEQVAMLLEVNLNATIRLCEALLPGMQQRGRGQIALVSSLSAYFGLPLTPSYCASKAGLKAYGEALRGWLAPRGIAVNVIMPGFVTSDMSERFPGPRPFILSPERAARLIQRGLARNRARIAFPWPLRVGMWWLAVLPPDLSLMMLRLFGFTRPIGERD